MKPFSYAVDLELAANVVASLVAVDRQLDEVVVDLRWRVARLHEIWAGTAAAAHLERARAPGSASYAEMHDGARGDARRRTRPPRDNYSDGRHCEHVDVGCGAVMLVDSVPLVDASSCFEHGNQSAALVHDTLRRRLSDCGAMAGDASIAEEFASAYDDAASSCLAAVGDLVDAFTTCGRLTAACLANHGHAENRSLISGRTVFTGTPCVAGYVSVLPCSLPSSLGGDLSGLPSWASWILDQVEGFVWPDADTDRLREAAVGLAGRLVPGRRPLGVLLVGDPLVLLRSAPPRSRSPSR